MAFRVSGTMETIRETLDSSLESVDKAEEIASGEAAKFGLNEDDQAQFGMAVRECMVNAVVHGNRYSEHKKVRLAIERTDDALRVTVGDEGDGFDLSSLPDPLAPENLLRRSGRGLLLIRAFVDEFDLEKKPGGGTEVRLVKKRPDA